MVARRFLSSAQSGGFIAATRELWRALGGSESTHSPTTDYRSLHRRLEDAGLPRTRLPRHKRLPDVMRQRLELRRHLLTRLRTEAHEQTTDSPEQSALVAEYEERQRQWRRACRACSLANFLLVRRTMRRGIVTLLLFIPAIVALGAAGWMPPAAILFLAMVLILVSQELALKASQAKVARIYLGDGPEATPYLFPPLKA